MKKYKLAFLTSQVIEDQAPLFKKLARHPDIDLMVYFCRDIGVNKPGKEEEFGVEIKYSNSLLEGYQYKFLKNFSPKPSNSFLGMINFGIIFELFRHRYDAIIIHGYSHFTDWLAFLGAFLSRTPIFLRGEVVLKPNQAFWKKLIKKIFFYPLFKYVSAFLIMIEKNKDFYRYYGADENKFFLTPSAVDNERFQKEYEKLKDKKEELRNNLGISKEAVVILFVGKLVHRKKPIDLLNAYKILFNNEEIKKENIALIYVGDGELKKEMEDYVKKNNLKNIFLVGFKDQSDITKYYTMSDIFVLPSTAGEVLPVVINEAMCFRLPIIVSDAIPSSSEFVKHGENGYIFPCGNVEKLVDYLRDLINNKEKREKFGKKSFEIIQNYTYEKDVEGILEALNYVKRNK